MLTRRPTASKITHDYNGSPRDFRAERLMQMPQEPGKYHCLRDKWCCRASRRWRQESGSHPDCSAWLSQCTQPWRPWFPILYLPEIKAVKSVRKSNSHTGWCFEWSIISDRVFLPGMFLNALHGNINNSTGNLKLIDFYSHTTSCLKALIPKSTPHIMISCVHVFLSEL